MMHDAEDDMDVIFGFSHFSDRFRHITWKIASYGFKDMIFLYLMEKTIKIKIILLLFIIQDYYYLIIVVYLNNCLEFKK